jgi:hypothetical protein
MRITAERGLPSTAPKEPAGAEKKAP